jgi:eukaryotic-like serine/threonine-protein kinase
MAKKALVAGVDDYSGSPLNGCVNDATRIALLLDSPLCGYDLKLLTNSEVTRGAVRAGVQWALQESECTVIYFAGHGWKTQVSTYLVTHDSTPHEEGVDFLWLTEAVKRLSAPAQAVVLILDCCHSGDANARDQNESGSPIKPSDLSMTGGTGRVLLAACRGNEAALELVHNGISHGAFTHYLCEALEGAAADNHRQVTVNSAFDYVAYQLAAAGRQTPVLRGDQEGHIALAVGVEKLGSWNPAAGKKLSLAEAQQRAEELITEAHRLANGGTSYEAWRNGEYADACRRFEPILGWFKKRASTQHELLQDPLFRGQYDSSQHFYDKLCAFEEGFKLQNGVVLKRIGSGGFGTVWKMSGCSWSHPVCFKSFHPTDLLDREKVSRFRRGYEAMRQLDHPNIVKVRELTELPLGFYMDYVDGPNLRTLRPGSALDPEQIVGILLEVAETLKHAHVRGVIHRDVKPENILIEVTSEAEYVGHLTDFDLAWFSTATQVTKLAEGFGSHFYAAPEQINSPQSAVAHRSTVDAYSFGQLCFFSVCNRDPQAFDHDNNARALSNELGTRWNDADASKEFLSLYVDCTKRNAKDRVSDFREISDRLAVVASALSNVSESYDPSRFMQQLAFNLSGRIPPEKASSVSHSVRSRSGRTGMTLIWSREAPSVCALEVIFRPNELHMDGVSVANIRSILNQRVDSMLRDNYKAHSAERRGAKGGGFEITVKFDHIPKDMTGVLKAREIISRVVDLLEQA